MYNPGDGMVMVANNTFKAYTNMMLVVKTYTVTGKDSIVSQVFSDITPTTTKRYFDIKDDVNTLKKAGGGFVELELLDHNKNILSQNVYWLADTAGNYSGLHRLPASQVQASAKQISPGKVMVTLTNPGNAPVAFFNRLSLVDANHKRLLPVFYSDNYISVLPGEHKTITMDYDTKQYVQSPAVSISGWNKKEEIIAIQP
jgi:hypothetical protein